MLHVMQPRRTLINLLFVCLIMSCLWVVPFQIPEDESTAEKLKRAGATPCPEDSSFLCLALTVPLKHDNLSGPTIDIAFAVHLAPPKKRRGVFVTIVGGPGYSGIDDLYSMDYLDPRFAEFDEVFFDLRGVRRSAPLDCPVAASGLYGNGLSAFTPKEEALLVQKARSFAQDCVTETGVSLQDLPNYKTSQASEDLEAFRQLFFEDDQLTLYGTQLAQTYAAKHPAQVRAMVLDGTVDLTLGHVEYMLDLNRTVSGLLDRTLSTFLSAAGATAEERLRNTYQSIADTLSLAPITIDYPLQAGGTSARIFRRAELDTTTSLASGDASTRAALLQGLASAFSQNDFLPLLELSYEATGVDPETAGPLGTAAIDPGMSDAAYYSTTCNDYGNEDKTESELLAEYLTGAAALRKEGAQVISFYYSDLPCVFWPGITPQAATPPAALPGVPVLVVGATGDAFVPVQEGRSVFSRLQDGYLVELDGGHHVIYGVGVSCIDEPINRFLLNLERPQQRQTYCSEPFITF
jgi:pimeloyl-ACP methyl ester carboxylesterase